MQGDPRQVRSRVKPRATGHFAHGRRLLLRARDLLDDRRADTQPVRLVLLDAERRVAQAPATSVLVHEVDARPVGPGRRLRTRLEVPREQPVVRQSDPRLERRVAARVGDPHLDRRARHGPEIALAHDAEQARRLARPIQPAVRVERGLEALGVVLRRVFAADVEAGPGEAAVVAPIRHERDVVAVAHHEHRRRPVPLEVFGGNERGVPLGIGRGRQDRQSVLAEELHLGARHGLPGRDGMHEDVLARVGVGLDQEAEIRDQRQTAVRPADWPLLFRVPTLHLHEEHTARVEERIEVQGREDLFARTGGVQLDDAGGQRREVVHVERVPVPEPGIPDVAARLAGQVVERVGQELLDVHPDGRHAAPGEREQAVAGQRQEGPVLRDGGLPGVTRGAHDRLVTQCEHEVARRRQTRRDAQVDEAAGRCIEHDALQHGGVALGGIHRQGQRVGLGEDLLRGLAGRPAVVPVSPPANAMVPRQQPCPHAAAERLGAHLVREGHHCGLQGIAVRVPDDRRADLLDAEVALAIGHAYLCEQRLFEHAVAVCGPEIRVHREGHEVLALRDSDDVRVHVGGAVVRAVLDAEAEFVRLGGGCLFESFAHGEGQASLEVLSRDGVREAEARRHAAFRDDLRVLVEACFEEFGDEGGRLELDDEVGQFDVRREQVGGQSHAVLAVCGPVLGRLERQSVLRHEGPLAGCRRVEFDAFLDDVADEIEACGREGLWSLVLVGRVGEVEMEGCDDQFVPLDAGESRCVHLHLHLKGLREALVVEVGADGQRGRCDQCRDAVPDPPRTRRACSHAGGRQENSPTAETTNLGSFTGVHSLAMDASQ